MQPRLGIGGQGGVIDAFGDRNRIDGHGGETTREAVEVAYLAVDGGPAEVFEQVIVDMHAVEGGRGGLHLVAPGQVVGRKVRECLSRSHALART